MLDKLPKSVSSEISESNIIVSTPVYEQCFVDMKTKKTPKDQTENNIGGRKG